MLQSEDRIGIEDQGEEERKEEEKHNNNNKGNKENLNCVKEGAIVEGHIGKVRPSSYTL